MRVGARKGTSTRGYIGVELSPINCALAIVVPYFLAGIVQTLFLKSRVSDRFTTPIDRGLTFMGERLLGDNKTLKGFVVMIPATTLSFWMLGLMMVPHGESSLGVWDLTVEEWTGLGFASVLGYTLGELPNSFIKRRLGISPGGAPTDSGLRGLFLVIDQLDSIVVALLVISLLVPTSGAFWMASLVIGGLLHYGFNWVLYWIGLKERAA